jgi:hypothetical protein
MPNNEALMSAMIATDPRMQSMDAFGALMDASASHNPMAGLCGAPCAHYGVVRNTEWCNAHGRRTSAIDGCATWTQVGTPARQFVG